MINALIVQSLLAALPCSMMPGPTQAVVRVEQDTMLRFGAARMQIMSASGVRPGVYDSLLATDETLMPGGRVRLLQLDSATRAAFAAQGIRDSQPVAFIRAAPYRADCRVIRWTDTTPFVRRGDVGYIRATLLPREQWINGIPLLVMPGSPYTGGSGRGAPLASPSDMFSLNVLLETWNPITFANERGSSSDRRRLAMAWARANPAPAELEPARSMLREIILAPDWGDAERIPSRLRGTYRVDVESDATRVSWFFRTHDRPGFSWRAGDSLWTTAGLLASPHVSGYRLVGHGATSPDSIDADPRSQRAALVWLATTDRPTAPNNDARRVLSGTLEFMLGAAPESFWGLLEPLVPPLSASEAAFYARIGRPLERHRRQAQLPITVRLDGRGGVRGDTVLVAGGKVVRVSIQRVDTLWVRRPW